MRFFVLVYLTIQFFYADEAKKRTQNKIKHGERGRHNTSQAHSEENADVSIRMEDMLQYLDRRKNTKSMLREKKKHFTTWKNIPENPFATRRSSLSNTSPTKRRSRKHRTYQKTWANRKSRVNRHEHLVVTSPISKFSVANTNRKSRHKSSLINLSAWQDTGNEHSTEVKPFSKMNGKNSLPKQKKKKNTFSHAEDMKHGKTKHPEKVEKLTQYQAKGLVEDWQPEYKRIGDSELEIGKTGDDDRRLIRLENDARNLIRLNDIEKNYFKTQHNLHNATESPAWRKNNILRGISGGNVSRKDFIPRPPVHQMNEKRDYLSYPPISYEIPDETQSLGIQQLNGFPSQYPDVMNMHPMNEIYARSQMLDRNDQSILGSYLKNERDEENNFENSDRDTILFEEPNPSMYEDEQDNTEMETGENVQSENDEHEKWKAKRKTLLALLRSAIQKKKEEKLKQIQSKLLTLKRLEDSRQKSIYVSSATHGVKKNSTKISLLLHRHKPTSLDANRTLSRDLLEKVTKHMMENAHARKISSETDGNVMYELRQKDDNSEYKARQKNGNSLYKVRQTGGNNGNAVLRDDNAEYKVIQKDDNSEYKVRQKDDSSEYKLRQRDDNSDYKTQQKDDSNEYKNKKKEVSEETTGSKKADVSENNDVTNHTKQMNSHGLQLLNISYETSQKQEKSPQELGKARQEIKPEEIGEARQMNEFQFNGQIKLVPGANPNNIRVVHGPPPEDFAQAFGTPFPPTASNTPFVPFFGELPPGHATAQPHLPTFKNGFQWAWHKGGQMTTKSRGLPPHTHKTTRRPATTRISNSKRTTLRMSISTTPSPKISPAKSPKLTDLPVKLKPLKEKNKKLNNNDKTSKEEDGEVVLDDDDQMDKSKNMPSDKLSSDKLTSENTTHISDPLKTNVTDDDKSKEKKAKSLPIAYITYEKNAPYTSDTLTPIQTEDSSRDIGEGESPSIAMALENREETIFKPSFFLNHHRNHKNELKTLHSKHLFGSNEFMEKFGKNKNDKLVLLNKNNAPSTPQPGMHHERMHLYTPMNANDNVQPALNKPFYDFLTSLPTAKAIGVISGAASGERRNYKNHQRSHRLRNDKSYLKTTRVRNSPRKTTMGENWKELKLDFSNKMEKPKSESLHSESVENFDRGTRKHDDDGRKNGLMTNEDVQAKGSVFDTSAEDDVIKATNTLTKSHQVFDDDKLPEDIGSTRPQKVFESTGDKRTFQAVFDYDTPRSDQKENVLHEEQVFPLTQKAGKRKEISAKQVAEGLHEIEARLQAALRSEQRARPTNKLVFKNLTRDIVHHASLLQHEVPTLDLTSPSNPALKTVGIVTTAHLKNFTTNSLSDEGVDNYLNKPTMLPFVDLDKSSKRIEDMEMSPVKLISDDVKKPLKLRLLHDDEIMKLVSRNKKAYNPGNENLHFIAEGKDEESQQNIDEVQDIAGYRRESQNHENTTTTSSPTTMTASPTTTVTKSTDKHVTSTVPTKAHRSTKSLNSETPLITPPSAERKNDLEARPPTGRNEGASTDPISTSSVFSSEQSIKTTETPMIASTRKATKPVSHEITTSRKPLVTSKQPYVSYPRIKVEAPPQMRMKEKLNSLKIQKTHEVQSQKGGRPETSHNFPSEPFYAYGIQYNNANAKIPVNEYVHSDNGILFKYPTDFSHQDIGQRVHLGDTTGYSAKKQSVTIKPPRTTVTPTTRTSTTTDRSSKQLPVNETNLSSLEQDLNMEDMYWTDSADEIENACRKDKATNLVVNILAFGDSLTRGYYNKGKNHHPYTMKLQYLLNKMDAKRCFIVENEGRDGDVAFGEMPKRMEEVFKDYKKHFDWVIILGGTNDIYNKKHAGHHTATELSQNILSLHNIAHHYGSKTVAITIPEVLCDVSENCQDMKQVREALNENIRSYANDHKSSVLLCDLADSLVRNKIDHKLVGQFFEGGLHLRPRGYELMARLIFDSLKQILDK